MSKRSRITNPLMQKKDIIGKLAAKDHVVWGQGKRHRQMESNRAPRNLEMIHDRVDFA